MALPTKNAKTTQLLIEYFGPIQSNDLLLRKNHIGVGSEFSLAVECLFSKHKALDLVLGRGGGGQLRNYIYQSLWNDVTD